MRKDCSEPSRSCQDPLTICRVLTTCSCQVQHVLREGQQDLCHLQGGEETAALHPAGHRVVCGRVSMPWPSEGTPGGGGMWPALVSAEKLRLAGAFTVQGPVPGEEGFRHLGKGRGPWERRGGVAGCWQALQRIQILPSPLSTAAATQRLGLPFWE